MNLANFNHSVGKVAVSADHLRMLLELIERFIPAATVWAFGSRIKGTHLPASDLDLAVHCDRQTAADALLKFRDALEESNLPFKVQVLDYHTLPENMQSNIKSGYVEIYRFQK